MTGLRVSVEIAFSTEAEAGEDEGVVVGRVGLLAVIDTGVDTSEGSGEEENSEDGGCDESLGREGALRGVGEGIVAGAERYSSVSAAVLKIEGEFFDGPATTVTGRGRARSFPLPLEPLIADAVVAGCEVSLGVRLVAFRDSCKVCELEELKGDEVKFWIGLVPEPGPEMFSSLGRAKRDDRDAWDKPLRLSSSISLFLCASFRACLLDMVDDMIMIELELLSASFLSSSEDRVRSMTPSVVDFPRLDFFGSFGESSSCVRSTKMGFLLPWVDDDWDGPRNLSLRRVSAGFARAGPRAG